MRFSLYSELVLIHDLTGDLMDMLFLQYQILIRSILVQARPERTFCLIRDLFVFVFHHSVLFVHLKLRHEHLHCALLNLHASKMPHRMLHRCTCYALFRRWLWGGRYTIYGMQLFLTYQYYLYKLKLCLHKSMIHNLEIKLIR